MKQPQPKSVKVVCDVCGQEWSAHKPNARGKVGLEECVRLLKAELAKPRQPFVYTSASPSINPGTTWGNFSLPH